MLTQRWNTCKEFVRLDLGPRGSTAGAEPRAISNGFRSSPASVEPMGRAVRSPRPAGRCRVDVCETIFNGHLISLITRWLERRDAAPARKLQDDRRHARLICHSRVPSLSFWA